MTVETAATTPAEIVTTTNLNANLLPLTRLVDICELVKVDEEGFCEFPSGLYRIDPETELDDDQRDLYTLTPGGLSELIQVDADRDINLEVQLIRELPDGTMILDIDVCW